MWLICYLLYKVCNGPTLYIRYQYGRGGVVVHVQSVPAVVSWCWSRPLKAEECLSENWAVAERRWGPSRKSNRRGSHPERLRVIIAAPPAEVLPLQRVAGEHLNQLPSAVSWQRGRTRSLLIAEVVYPQYVDGESKRAWRLVYPFIR